MSFKQKVDEHITQMLNEGVLPDSGEIVEMEVGPRLHDMTVPGQQLGPQHSGPEGGPVSAPAATFPWLGKLRAADRFPGACMGRDYTAPPFSNQNRQIPPALFSGAAMGMAEEDEIDRDAVIDAVLADLSELQESAMPTRPNPSKNLAWVEKKRRQEKIDVLKKGGAAVYKAGKGAVDKMRNK